MATGPSKQELEMYWQNSRQYFDELAKYYQTSDPDYYREYIKPFYDNPFSSTYSGNNQSSGSSGKVIFVAVFLFIFIGLLSVGVFFFISKEKVEEITVNKKVTEKPSNGEDNKNNSVNENAPAEEDASELSGEDNYIIGAKYIGEKKYDKAEYHLKIINRGDKRYKEAQQLLESIKYLKKYDK